ncbi:23S rRNA (adenine(2030)-N(6))-methyltransferase RlmJ [Opitutus sp. ER46]|uniref:23S rRNA (adenine(2030)-N(6))-methyltransferase RlmJ n=1 Tax=Opitutus sp. ER46 TaxID=2161864 RepID=UPI000D2FD219|nr:23S rRNA (adenine(2030)-N(6))-methyltransferase RlmJ [Opitutus sp. ER46]PTY01069.1 23S rRNA (adenine(2030)-N(6))-methyltransferase RlmJ [Opitutus sp. ER46]
MNYRHHYHAGNFADVMKHVLLVRLLRALQQKPKPYLYLDTHAGRGAYDLRAAAIGDTLARTPEWPDGIGRLWHRAGLPEPVADYVALVREFDRARGNLESEVRYYPGSPVLASRVLRAEDRLALCEKHPAECDALRLEFGRRRTGPEGPGAAVQDMDGYTAIRAVLPPRERRALILVDPPYEAQDEFAQVATALGEGLKRFPSGVFALWYPLTERARVRDFLSAIVAGRPPATLVAELAIAGDEAARKLKGCGLVIVNPPWRFEAEARGTLGFLADVLAQEPGAAGRVDWLVPEQ